MISLRIRTDKGVFSLPTMYHSNNVADLKHCISNISGINANNISLKKGYPPMAINIQNDLQLLSDLNFASGDLLLVSEINSQPKSKPPPEFTDYSNIYDIGILVKRVVPADNSCLFTSINFLLTGQFDLSGECISKYRNIICDTILLFSNPEYTQDYRNTPYNMEDFQFLKELITPAMLGRPTFEYAKWITSHQSWGGAIEVAIFSRYFRVEIDVVDIRSCRLEKFGQEANYPDRILLLYDGIHYDPLVLKIPGFPTQFLTKFPINNDTILCQALSIAEDAKKTHKYTSVSDFRLKCYDCGIFLSGEKQAKEHAKSSGHTNFGEIPRD